MPKQSLPKTSQGKIDNNLPMAFEMKTRTGWALMMGCPPGIVAMLC
jgi:hypothetical protein